MYRDSNEGLLIAMGRPWIKRQCSRTGWEWVFSFNKQQIPFKIILQELDLRLSVEVWGFPFSLLVEKFLKCIDLENPGSEAAAGFSANPFVLSLLSIWIHFNTKKSSIASEIK